MKRRIISAILVICMLVGMCPVGVHAADEPQATGELCLTLFRAGAVAAAEYAVTLTDSGGHTAAAQTVTAAQGDMKVSAALADIADGDYTLTVSAPACLTYQQALTFDGRCVSLDLYNYASVNDGRTEEDGLFGTMPAGDVNGDGVIDDADADLITANMGGSGICDLNGDGTVDLTDLTAAVRNQAAVVPAQPVHTVSSAVLRQAVAVTAAQGTEITGEPKDLLDQQEDSAGVALSPENGEVISERSPVSVELAVEDATAVQAEALTVVPPAQSESYPTAGVFTVEGADGEGNTVTFRGELGTAAGTARVQSHDQPVEITVENDGTVVINLGYRVAIKKVTIRVTATADQGNLAEIAKVEFLSDFAERIGEPQLSIPTVLSVTNTESNGLGYKDLTVTWKPVTNIVGYEVNVSGNGLNWTKTTTDTSLTFIGDSYNGTVVSFKTYNIKVRSFNGDWYSDWSEVYRHEVTCTRTPPAPENLSVTAGIRSLEVSWTCAYDAEWFTLYYKQEDAAEYETVEKIPVKFSSGTWPGSSAEYTLEDLEPGVRYVIQVQAHNRNGAGRLSGKAEGIPKEPGVDMPKYKLINVDNEEGMATTHISKIYPKKNSRPYTIYRPDGTTVDNKTAAQTDWEVLLNNNPNSYLYFPYWDNGGWANGGRPTDNYFVGPVIELDQPYTMDTFRLSNVSEREGSLYHVHIGYMDENGEVQKTEQLKAKARYDSQDRRYYEVVLDEPITTNYLEICTAAMNGMYESHTICEVKLYEYDDLEDLVAELFEDDGLAMVKDSVTEEQVLALMDRANTPDPVSGELHPHVEAILLDLEYALQFVRDRAALAEPVHISDRISNEYFADTPARLNSYQPLNCVAAAGDTIVIYVTRTDGYGARGSSTYLRLVYSQYQAEDSKMFGRGESLKIGRNEIRLDRLGSYNREAGGSIYVSSTYNAAYTVRVLGGTKIPTLRADGLSGEDRMAAIRKYVAELKEYVPQIESKHNERHQGSENKNVDYDYDQSDCFLNSTEILMDNMMYSLPATAVLAGLNSEDPAEQLATAIAAMEQEIDYFYQFRGFNRAAEGRDRYPSAQLNMRWAILPTGAYAYAGSDHIGIPYGSIYDLMHMKPVVADEKGKKLSGGCKTYNEQVFAHEIGHCVNSDFYERAEVTNEVFTQLMRTDETNATFPTSYRNVYKAVLRGNTGHTGDLAVQLAMYWQLHLAYDNDYTYKVYDSIEAQQNGLFYARLDSYLRTRSKANPALPGTTSYGDQAFMRAACAAAKKDILDFFRAWGFKPDEETLAYAANFEKESRKIQYIDDDSRLYRLEGGPGMSAGTQVTAAITNAVKSRINGNRVIISLANSNTNPNAMLGYEIRRNGKAVGFVTPDQTSFTDYVTTENNRAFVYTVVGIDRLLNETETVVLPEVKVCHDGTISKEKWTATASLRDQPGLGTSVILDNDPYTVFFTNYSWHSSGDYVTLDLGGVEQVTALKFTPAPDDYVYGTTRRDLSKHRLFNYQISVSLDGRNWLFTEF